MEDLKHVLLFDDYDPILPFEFLEGLESLFDTLLKAESRMTSKRTSLTNMATDLLKVLMRQKIRTLNLFRISPARCFTCHTANIGFIVGSVLVAISFPYAFTIQGIKSALLHDIGHLLLKSESPEDDRDEKRENYRLHPVLGYRLCTQLDLSPDECDAVLYHHERFDGRGFLNRKGKEIPFYARLIRLADEVEHLLMNRGKEPLDFPESLFEMKGTVLDPELVDDFLKTFGPIPIGTRILWEGRPLVCVGMDKNGGELVFDAGSGNFIRIPLELLAKTK